LFSGGISVAQTIISPPFCEAETILDGCRAVHKMMTIAIKIQVAYFVKF
jgi:hypothetical protein